jgi:hypothetical protein
MDQICPKCNLVNPPYAQRCDCGWDFVSRRQERSYLGSKPKTTPALLSLGAIVLILLVLRFLLGFLGFLGGQ